jgi:hypothetical protein
MKSGANTEQIGTGPEVIRLLFLIRQKRHLPLRKIPWPIQPDVVKVHLTQTAEDHDIIFRTQANRYPVNIGQDYTLIFDKGRYACSSEGVSFCTSRSVML